MFMWRIVAGLVVFLQGILFPRWLYQGRRSRRLILLLMLLLLAVEFLPATHPLKVEIHAFYAERAATVAGWYDAGWRPRLQAAAAMGALAAELDRQYWLEADTTVLLQIHTARAAQWEVGVARLHQELHEGIEKQRQFEVAQAELARSYQMVESLTAARQRIQALRLDTETGLRRLDDHLALLNTVTIYEMPALMENGRTHVLEQELERRRRIAHQRAQLEASLAASPVQ